MDERAVGSAEPEAEQTEGPVSVGVGALPGRLAEVDAPVLVAAQGGRRRQGSRRLTWMATEEDGTAVAVAGLRLFTRPGQEHLAELELHAAPEHRHRGAGSRLLSAVAACRTENRRSLVVATGADGPGEAFAERWHSKPVLTLDHLVLELGRLDQDAIRASRRRRAPRPPAHRRLHRSRPPSRRVAASPAVRHRGRARAPRAWSGAVAEGRDAAPAAR
ncbi:GNAT family N-acetyltransferase [Streptomyces sp. NPDC046727]|uniref:GNAT family N-acetyltransferase n=1 Tax=Streptomyces sp. NPDC046727 TaxID=3155373 RepID=UPI003408B90B